MANPNPSPSTRFGAERGNPIAGGKSSKQREAEYRAAEQSAELRARILSFIMESTEGDDKALYDMLNSDLLRLFKDSEDRAHGTPKNTSEVSAQVAVKNALDLTDDELAAFLTGAGGEGAS